MRIEPYSISFPKAPAPITAPTRTRRNAAASRTARTASATHPRRNVPPASGPTLLRDGAPRMRKLNHRRQPSKPKRRAAAHAQSGVRHGARRRPVCVSRNLRRARPVRRDRRRSLSPHRIGRRRHRRRRLQHPSIVMGTRRRAHPVSGRPAMADRPYGSRTVGDAGAAPLCLAMVRIEATGDASVGPVEVAPSRRAAAMPTPLKPPGS